MIWQLPYAYTFINVYACVWERESALVPRAREIYIERKRENLYLYILCTLNYTQPTLYNSARITPDIACTLITISRPYIL